jgi:hypothetical protein
MGSVILIGVLADHQFSKAQMLAKRRSFGRSVAPPAAVAAQERE